MLTMRRAIAAGSLLVAVAAIAVAIVRTTGDDAAVLGTKVGRCQTVDGGTAVASGVHRLAPENAPLTVTVSGGRISSVLAPAVKIEPDTAPVTQVASVTIGRPQTSGRAITADVTLRNLTDCPIGVGLARASLQRSGASSVASTIRFGGADQVVVQAGQQVAGSFSVPMSGDGSYQITATTEAEIGRVR